MPVALPDPDDLPFLEVAWASAAPLVTGNLAHFPEEARGPVAVWSPRAFVEAWVSAR